MLIGEEHQALHLWSLTEDVMVRAGEVEDQLILSGRWGEERLDRVTPVVREALRRMELGPVLLANLPDSREFPGARACVYLVVLPALRRLNHLVVRTLAVDDLKGPLLSVSPVSRHAPFALVELPAGVPVQLSRDVTITVGPGGFVLESAESSHQVFLHRPEAAWVVGMLAWPVTPAAVSEVLPLPAMVIKEILDYLVAASMASPTTVPARGLPELPEE